MITIDGSQGEGGGQILRSALSLSMITGQAFRIHGIRAGRKKPGLLRQHLTAVQAATQIADATVTGDTLGASTLQFTPNGLQPGDYQWSIGTAGSTTLVLQTVLLPLALAGGASNLSIKGGTHNKAAPSFEFLAHAFLPLLQSMGPRVTLELARYGFYPRGGGELRVRIDPVDRLQPLHLPERGQLQRCHAEATVAGIPGSVAQRELTTVQKRLKLDDDELQIRQLDPSMGPGNTLVVIAEHRHLTEVFVGYGERQLSAETVAKRTAGDAVQYLKGTAAVGPYLADQLLLPMALAASGSFTTSEPTEHFHSNAAVINAFTDTTTKTADAGGVTEVSIGLPA